MLESRAAGLVPTLRSLPRTLMPLLLFLYRFAKYSHSSLSAEATTSPSLMEANLAVRSRMVRAWNLFWWDLSALLVRQSEACVEAGRELKLTLRFPSWVNCLPHWSRRQRYGLACS